MMWLRATVSALALSALGSAGVLALAPAAWAQAEPAQVSAFNPEDAEQKAFVDGNLLFLTYHEIGHLLIEVGLDVDQRAERRNAEEAADDIATFLMLPDPDEPDQDGEIIAAIEGWATSADRQDGVAASPHYPDDGERAARIACYLYGTNPKEYEPFEKIFAAALASVNCVEESEVMQADIAEWFATSLIDSDTQPGAAPRVVYQPAPSALQAARAYLKSSGILEAASADIAEFVRLPETVSIVGMSCGGGAAEFRYTPGAAMITACYEAVDSLMRDAAGEEQARAETRQAIEDGSLGSGGARVTQRPRLPRGTRR